MSAVGVAEAMFMRRSRASSLIVNETRLVN
jgi:hypothetical protein